MATCILCGGADPEVFLDLGQTPLANKFLTAAELDRPEQHYPLRVAYCHACGHVQLAEMVPPSAMFEDYLYISSISQTLKTHLHELAGVVTDWRKFGPDDLVVDIGCNDGTLLEGFKARGVRILGVDPARNLAPLARDKGVPVEIAFFGETIGKSLRERHGPARAMTMTNAFPHIPALGDLLRGVDALLADDGVFVIEAHYLLDMIEQVAFDTVYHEHVSYWALAPMMRLFARFGLEIVRVERLPIHHGQLRVFVQRVGRGQVDDTVKAVLEKERAAGIPGFASCQAFAQAAYRVRDDLQKFLAKATADGRTVAAYGAPAKGNTLLSFLGLNKDQVAWIADRSPLKQGRFAPGSHLAVVPP
jgi:SAM-dependent methyltransferase